MSGGGTEGEGQTILHWAEPDARISPPTLRSWPALNADA